MKGIIEDIYKRACFRTPLNLSTNSRANLQLRAAIHVSKVP